MRRRLPRCQRPDTLLPYTTLFRSYWQCAQGTEKGGFRTIEARGIAAFRDNVAALVPGLAAGIDAVGSFDDVKLLSVALDRLTRWSRPGLPAIGDAAPATSPIGGGGIHLTAQDAVAAPSLLAPPLPPRVHT